MNHESFPRTRSDFRTSFRVGFSAGFLKPAAFLIGMALGSSLLPATPSSSNWSDVSKTREGREGFDIKGQIPLRGTLEENTLVLTGEGMIDDPKLKRLLRTLRGQRGKTRNWDGSVSTEIFLTLVEGRFRLKELQPGARTGKAHVTILSHVDGMDSLLLEAEEARLHPFKSNLLEVVMGSLSESSLRKLRVTVRLEDAADPMENPPTYQATLELILTLSESSLWQGEPQRSPTDSF
jgi:hypothetical protein